MDIWAEIASERKELLGLLESLAPEQWDTPSLCSEWRVRDVVAHLVAATRVQPMAFVTGVLKERGDFNKFLARDARERGEQPAERLVEEFRVCIESRAKPPVVRPGDVLIDSLVHQQDIRRPLGMARTIPEPRLHFVADRLKGMGIGMGVKKRIAGLRLQATDIDWATGSGPEVTGPAEALVLAMAGRRAPVDDLSGEGKLTLASRL